MRSKIKNIIVVYRFLPMLAAHHYISQRACQIHKKADCWRDSPFYWITVLSRRWL